MHRERKLIGEKKFAYGLTLFLFFHFSFVAQTYAQAEEYFVKAVYLEKFGRFVEWPSEALQQQKVFTIAVYGKNPFGEILNEVYNTQKVKEKTVKLYYWQELPDELDCNLLFIGKVTPKQLEGVLARTKGKPILTVSEHEDFAENGVMINMYLHNDKIRFEINETVAHNSPLGFNFRLLQLARIVQPLND